MRLSIFGRKKEREGEPGGISGALADPRADVAVAEWLQLRVLGDRDDLPQEVHVAYRVDHFLQEVNMGGSESFIAQEPDEVPLTIEALHQVGLRDIADSLMAAADVGSEELDNKVMADSKRIEAAVHAYIRQHLPVFESVD